MFKQNQTIILASNSWGRKHLLDLAMINYRVAQNPVSDAQEDSFKDTVKHLDTEEQILKIATYKGLEVSKKYPDMYIVSGDQACVFNNTIVSKPKTRAEAIGQLTAHAGHEVTLTTAGVICKNGEAVWSHIESPKVKFRKFSMKDAESYVDAEEKSETGSVVGIAGACKLESPHGIHMIEKADGNHNTIIGLPLNALINELYVLNILN